jgi:hypothetical protein
MSTTGDSLADALQAGAAVVERCREAPAPEAKKAFGEAMVQIIRARNEHLGARAASAGDPRLPRVNALLSVMSSIEFPLGGFHRERLGEVDQAIHALIG